MLLDENLPAGQRLLLRKWRIPFRVIGLQVATWGTDDRNLLPVLHRLPQPTFLSLDHDFYRHDWAHEAYSLVWLDVPDDRAAEFVRRFLKHKKFDTQAKRMGTVVRVHKGGLLYWRADRNVPESASWVTE